MKAGLIAIMGVLFVGSWLVSDPEAAIGTLLWLAFFFWLMDRLQRC